MASWNRCVEDWKPVFAKTCMCHTFTITLLSKPHSNPESSPDLLFFMAASGSMWDLSSLTRYRTYCPLRWKYGVLATGPARKSLILLILTKNPPTSDCHLLYSLWLIWFSMNLYECLNKKDFLKILS